METKKLEILVVEDNAKHLADAQAEVQRVIATGIQLAPSYAQTYEAAKALMKQSHFGGIISDIFFPWDSQIRDGKIQGWSPEAARMCYEALCNFSGLDARSREDYDRTISWLDDYRKMGTDLKNAPRDEIPQWLLDQGGRPVGAKMYQEAQRWQNGQSMHPTGVIVAEDARYSKIPIIFCTDTNHHGSTTEPVCQYARDHGINVVDATPRELGKGWRGGNASSKHWDTAIQTLLVAMVVAEQFQTLPKYDGGDRELDVRASLGIIGTHIQQYNLPKDFVESVVYSMQRWTK